MHDTDHVAEQVNGELLTDRIPVRVIDSDVPGSAWSFERERRCIGDV